MKPVFRKQLIPVSLTVVVFILLSLLLYVSILTLNLFPTKEKVILQLRPQDVLVGMTIYLKTAIDFAIFIGSLMHTNPGTKKRIAIEIGTALGNGIGTVLILTIWYFFKEVPLLMVTMILLASLVLLQMAEESLEMLIQNNTYKFVAPIFHLLQRVNSWTGPLFSRILPHTGTLKTPSMSVMRLMIFALTIPFLLGLDDFAGYIPLFSIINVFGFAVGVFFGHMLLNMLLFLSPKTTTLVVRHHVVLLLGGFAFIGIALWGFLEAFRIGIRLF